MQFRAPAKINLSFRILGRRADGFHDIDTLMAPISLHDSLTITRLKDAGKIDFVCTDSSLPGGDENLAVRAARLFLGITRSRAGVRIALEKNIPHGAGLGGGSSDAATVLLGLNQLLAAEWSEIRLAEVAAEIGSDVPFFIYQSAARCRGRGDIVTPIKLPKTVSLLLLKPLFGVPTPWAYQRWKESKKLPEIRYQAQEFSGLDLVNDLERSVFEKFIFMGHLKMWLLAQPEARAAIMSGSGSTLIAILRDGADAETLARRAKIELDSELWTCACRTM
ncbi:MAG: 4-(cytidine 5'-diphospho)-2-C-methyl-D-erythritol kinase [Chthoniobacterales bacterium]|nr:4-(cytidine 5'-diphospho)-2-C-methyl-D-erythritol kinase [Chthoniobacterales bacterium]